MLQVQAVVHDRNVDATIEVQRGRTLALIGANAAGKSTMLNVAAGMLKPDEGTVVLDDQVLTDTKNGIDVPVHKRGIGLLAQRGLMFPHLNVIDNVAFGPRSQGKTDQAVTIARHWLDEVGVGDLADKRSTELSGGQAQRVALARTLASQPRALLLDEPTSALDVRVSTELRQVLARVTGDLTTILVSHDVLDIVTLADEVAVISGGRIVESGPTLEVMRRPSTQFSAKLADVNAIPGRLESPNHLKAGDLDIYGIPDSETITGAGSALVKPSAITVSIEPPQSSARNVWRGTVATMATVLTGVRLAVDIGVATVDVDITAVSARSLQIAPGRDVYLSVKAQEVVIAPLRR